MTHRFANNYAKNYCNRTLIVKVIAENIVTCFFGTQCIHHVVVGPRQISRYAVISKFHANGFCGI